MQKIYLILRHNIPQFIPILFQKPQIFINHGMVIKMNLRGRQFGYSEQHNDWNISKKSGTYGRDSVLTRPSWKLNWVRRSLKKALLYYSHNRGGFGWDDKTAGYQVLMAQLTSDGTYTSDVRNYFNYLENDAPRTPKGHFSLLIVSHEI